MSNEFCRAHSAFAKNLFDAALQLLLFLLALAQPLVKIAAGASGAVMFRNASPTLFARRQIIRDRNERPFRGMARLISSGSLVALSNSTQAPCSERLRTTQSMVEPGSLMAATPPKTTLFRAR